MGLRREQRGDNSATLKARRTWPAGIASDALPDAAVGPVAQRLPLVSSLRPPPPPPLRDPTLHLHRTHHTTPYRPTVVHLHSHSPHPPRPSLALPCLSLSPSASFSLLPSCPRQPPHLCSARSASWWPALHPNCPHPCRPSKLGPCRSSRPAVRRNGLCPILPNAPGALGIISNASPFKGGCPRSSSASSDLPASQCLMLQLPAEICSAILPTGHCLQHSTTQTPTLVVQTVTAMGVYAEHHVPKRPHVNRHLHTSCPVSRHVRDRLFPLT